MNPVDMGLVEIQKLLQQVSFGNLEVRVKMHNNQVAKLEVPYSQNFKMNYTEAAAYFLEKLRNAQTQGVSTTFNITTEIKPNGDIFLQDNGYITQSFKIAP